ncbi:apoptotic chromatin condensation inducer in the nucleus isoform X2 [Salmo trutta]|uniref:apoptotic chromatin condensation inducer in the nucleus isoform X2 n=1 Tax=Salmo trutta TaxID=8032 RepID=UPI001130A1E8|nr:apoptotic chromatin condensation inducer in the nucleus-like isoform X2 [Salmo trutta]
MADLEDVTLDGRPLQSLRVADLKAALEERGLPKSGQKNALIKRLKGALMLENLQRTSHHHIGLQPNSQIGEEMSQNSFIKQYLAKQQELLRQRLEKEAREAVEDDDTDQEDHTQGNNSSACAAPDQDDVPVLVDQHKPLGPSEGEGLAGPASEGEGHRAKDGHVSGPPASTSPTSAPAAVASLSVCVADGEQRPERVPTSSQVPADSDDDSDGGDEDGEDEDWDSGARRRNLGEPPRGQLARERSEGSRQPPQHIPPLLSPQLRQPTPPPSPPPELSFPLPDTPKQSPPSPGELPARQRTSSTSSSGSSSSGSRSSSPEPQSNAERKPGPLTLLARKMASEGAFSGVGWHGRGEAERQDNNAATATIFPGRGPQEGTVSAITHTANAAASLPFPSLVPVTNQGVLGGHLSHSQVPVSVLRPTIMEERDSAWQQENKERELQAESEREKALEQERLRAVELERQRIFEQQRAMEQERERALEREREEREKALDAERKERERALEREREKALEAERKERERALERERAQALEQEREEREKALAEEREKSLARERALQLEKEKAVELERQRAMEQEQALQQEREERERAIERAKAFEREERERALEREQALEQERVETARALERERVEREKALERERALEREQLEREKALEMERIEREKALEQERVEKEKALELVRQKALKREQEEREKVLELERQKALELERQKALELELELERQKALELERQKALELERQKALELERQKALELERQKALELERQKALELERQKALELERQKALELERQKALELERQKALELERQKALELERQKALELERQKALELERQKALELERQKALELERQKALELERQKALELERQKALELERQKALELERQKALELERQKALEREQERQKALEQERVEKALELERRKALERELEEREKDREEKARALQQEIIEREKALEKERVEREKALEREREKERALEQKALQREKEERESVLEQDKERAKVAERESHLPPWKRGREIGLTPLPTPPLSTGAGRMAATEEGGEPHVPSLPQTASRDNQPAESGTPLSPTIATPLSPQSSFKKFRFLRDPPVLSPSCSASLVIKRPRTFSDSPHPQASALQSPRKPGEQEQESTLQGPKLSAGQAASQMPARQGFLVSGPTAADTSDTTGPEIPVIATLGKSPEKEKAKELASEEHVLADKETDKQKVGELARGAKGVDAGNVPSGPAESVMPPSPPPEEGNVDRGRERSQKKQEKRGRRASSSSDSSDSDSGSSSSRSSGSSSSSQGKTRTTPSGRKPEKPQTKTISQDETVSQLEESNESPKAPQRKNRGSGEKEEKDMTIDGARHDKKPFVGIPAGQDKEQKKDSEGEEEMTDTTREVKEAAMAEPERAPESSEESLTPKAFTARRISLSSSKASPGVVSAEGEAESGAGPGRKRRWGSSTAVTAKKPSISITTDSLKSLIPDIRLSPGQEAVVDLHPEETHLSGGEEDREQGEQDFKIRRTVTQVVLSDTQENGPKDSKRSENMEDREDGVEVKSDREEKMDDSFQRDSMETRSPSPPIHDMEMNTVTPSDTLIRRSISQQKSGVSITIDDPVRTAKQPSPPRGKVSNIVHLSNLVRPFTLGQLKELLSRTGTVLEDGFWIDKIKSHCYVTYSSAEEAVATRAALHGVKWPQSNPKFLSVDFSQQEELDFHRGLPPPGGAGEEERGASSVPGRGRGAALPPLLPERDQWAEREREMERRERTRAEREWDRDKVRDFGPGKPGEEAGPRRSRSRERKRKEKGKSKERKTNKKEKAAEEAPAKLLDDLFNKTKAAPCIYWLPLTEEQFTQREVARQERRKEREKRRKEQQEEEEKKREEERKERIKAGSSASGERGEGDRDRERDRERGKDRDRDREGDKRRESSHRRPGGNSAGVGRRSRSRSDPPPRDRRR